MVQNCTNDTPPFTATSARAKLSEPELYLAGHEDKLVILDEVHRVPDLFGALAG